ncbi:MarR family transcriptional regulator [Actinokineospora sp. NPDC004072]
MTTTPSAQKTRADIESADAAGAALQPVPDAAAPRRTDAEDKLWAALHAHPTSTAAALSAAAGIGKSTAQKILSRWAVEGGVSRTAGIAESGRRAADLWAISDEAVTPSDINAPDDDDAVESAPAVTDTSEPAPAPSVEASTTPDDVVSGTAGRDVSGTAHSEIAGPHDGVDTAEQADDQEAAETRGDASEGKVERLAPGALRGMVEDHLRDHPDQQCSPVEIARSLGGKSTGAVTNALDKLVVDGVAVRTQDRPKRYALAPAEVTTGSS